MTRVSSVLWICLFFAFLMMCGLVDAGFARERGPRVEVACPTRPVPLKLDKQTVLVYELHVTNFEVVPLTLKRIEIFANAKNSEPLQTIADNGLSASMARIGSNSAAKDVQTIEPGARAVVFLWIELQANLPVPASLQHRMTFSQVAPASGGSAAPDAVLEDFPVPVNTSAVPVLSLPFNGGTWFAGDGPVNDSAHRRSLIAVDGSVYMSERFAIDWAKVGANGDSHDGTAKNENWWGYGEPILAVADGEITQVLDGISENTPRTLPSKISLDNIAGNYVILRIGADLYVTYAHLQPGSIRVHLHDQVHRGAVLAKLGNSGQSTAPHLHFQLSDTNSVLQSEGLPFILEQFTYLGPGSAYELDKHPSIPWAGSIPPGNAVLEFQPVKK